MTEPRAPLPYPPAEIKQRLRKALPDLLARWKIKDELYGGKGDGQRIWPKSPLRNDRKPGSFCIWVTGESRGAWKDYAVDAHKGDIWGLIQAVERLQAWIDAYWWALDFLGMARDAGGARARPRTRADVDRERERLAADRIAAEAREAAAREAKSADLFKLWLSLPPIAGTPAERYLREARGIPMERLARAPGALRWAERLEAGHDPETGEVIEWRHCMVAAMTRGGKLAALHRTYLKPDGSGKADRAKPKLMIGPVKGAAIRLSAGPSGLSPSRAAKAGKSGPLAVGEGIETCLTVACARPDYRVWAAGSLSLMGLVEWPACASAVVLLGENDGKAAAREEFARVTAWWRGQAKGRPLEVAYPAVGGDFNDWARKTG